METMGNDRVLVVGCVAHADLYRVLLKPRELILALVISMPGNHESSLCIGIHPDDGGGECTASRTQGRCRIAQGRAHCSYCLEKRCANHCKCARTGQRESRKRGRAGAFPQPRVRSRSPAPANPPAPVPPPVPKASYLGMRVQKEDIASLRIREKALQERKLAQDRFNESRTLESTWGYGRFGLTTWDEAVHHGLTTWYLKHKANLGSKQLLHFLEFAAHMRASGGPASAASGEQDVVDAGVQENSVQNAKASVLAQLNEVKDRDLETRRGVFKSLLLKYHPDKNPGNETVSCIVFQFVMKQKEWFPTAA